MDNCPAFQKYCKKLDFWLFPQLPEEGSLSQV